MSYKDKTFCPESDKGNPKCLQCERFFDEQEYLNACDRTGYEIPVAWFLEPPCKKKERSLLKRRPPKPLRVGCK